MKNNKNHLKQKRILIGIANYKGIRIPMYLNDCYSIGRLPVVFVGVQGRGRNIYI